MRAKSRQFVAQESKKAISSYRIFPLLVYCKRLDVDQLEYRLRVVLKTIQIYSQPPRSASGKAMKPSLLVIGNGHEQAEERCSFVSIDQVIHDARQAGAEPPGRSQGNQSFSFCNIK